MTASEGESPVVTKAPGAAWHTLSPDIALERLVAVPEGLSTAASAQRLAAHGRNVIETEAPLRPLQILIAQFKSLLVAILAVAAAISMATGEWTDGIAILAIVILNGFIGFLQESKAERSLQTLKSLTAPQAKARRDGKTVLLAAAEIVPGDIVELEAGDLVPADARLLDAASLRTVEASLTGESLPVEKQIRRLDEADLPLGDRSNMVWMGTSVAKGRGTGVVVATGMSTEIGRIAGLLQETRTEDRTPLQRTLAAFGRMLAGVSLAVVGLVFLFGIIRGIEVLEIFLAAVSLAVAAVPEGLPAVVTIALAIGVQRMAHQRSLVRKLAAVETLGCASVICSDKTGTLTMGEMTVRTLWIAGRTWTVTGEGYAPAGEVRTNGGTPGPGDMESLRELMSVFAGCNTARLVEDERTWKVTGDPTEGALLAAAAKVGIVPDELSKRWPKVIELPFDAERKRMTIVRRRPEGGFRAMVKGAPDVILERCTHFLDGAGVRPISAADRQNIAAAVAGMGSQALRVLAAAYRDLDGEAPIPHAGLLECDLTFAGLAGMHDPPRPEAKDAVRLCKEAGIRVVMITGDHQDTALAVGRELDIAGIGDDVVSGAEVDAMDDRELERRLQNIAVYARTTAAHKLRLVRALQKNGAVVAMTGDGVNDAPAVKGADIGVAMGRTGTEVTKEASDMVVTDDNFATIVAAVREGRGIYANIKKTLQYLLAGNLGEILVMAASVLAGVPLPLLPIQILWINLVTDGLPALCLATDPIDPAVMREPPRPRDERLTERDFIPLMALSGTLTAVTVLAVYLWSLIHEPEAEARAHAFSCLVFIEVFKAFVFRSRTKLVWQIGLFSNLRLAFAGTLTLGLQIAAPPLPLLGDFLEVPPMPFLHSFSLIGIALIPPTILELLKLRSRSA